jgi:hypothetical protein
MLIKNTQKEIRMKRAKTTLEKINQFRKVNVEFIIKLSNTYRLERDNDHHYPFLIYKRGFAVTRGNKQLLNFIQRKPDLFREDIDLRIEEGILTNV